MAGALSASCPGKTWGLATAHSEKVTDHYENSCNVGRLDVANPNADIGMVGAPAYGDVVRL